MLFLLEEKLWNPVSKIFNNLDHCIGPERERNHRCLFTDFISRGYGDSISANYWLFIT